MAKKTFVLCACPRNKLHSFHNENSSETIIFAYITARTASQVWDYLATEASDKLFFSVICPNGSRPSQHFLDYANIAFSDRECHYNPDSEKFREVFRAAKKIYNTGEKLEEYANYASTSYCVFLLETNRVEIIEL
jgi:hypothetical protein